VNLEIDLDEMYDKSFELVNCVDSKCDEIRLKIENIETEFNKITEKLDKLKLNGLENKDQIIKLQAKLNKNEQENKENSKDFVDLYYNLVEKFKILTEALRTYKKYITILEKKQNIKIDNINENVELKLDNVTNHVEYFKSKFENLNSNNKNNLIDEDMRKKILYLRNEAEYERTTQLDNNNNITTKKNFLS